MADLRTVKVQNITNGRVGYNLPNRHIKRRFEARQILPIPFDELEEARYDTGVRAFFREGILKFLNPQDSVDLGFSETEMPKVTADGDEIIKLLLRRDYAEIAQFMKSAPKSVRETLIEVIVKNKLTDKGLVDLSRDILQYDVLEAVRQISRLEDQA